MNPLKFTIETSRLILREFEESDWNSVHSYAGNPEVVKYMDWGPNSEDDTKAFIKNTLFNQSLNSRVHFDFAITTKANGRLIGTAGIHIQDLSSQTGVFGYILHPEFWGQGFATEVAQSLIKYGFETLRLHRIWATCRPENLASARVLEKAGLRCEGVMRDHKKIRGQWVDSYLYAIVKKETAQIFKRSKIFQSTPITIRDANSKDASTLAEAERAIAQTPGFLVSKPSELRDELFQKKIEHLNTIANGKYIVAESSNKIVGHALLDPLSLSAVQHVVHLTIAVHEGHQEKGVGTGMLAHLIDWAKQNPSVEKIELNVRSSNLRAVALYQKLGFREEGRWKKRVKIADGQYLDDISMGIWVGKT